MSVTASTTTSEAQFVDNERSRFPSWAITLGSVATALGLWEFFGRDIDPLFGSYPSAILQAFFGMMHVPGMGDAK